VVDECFIEFLDEPERFSVMKELQSGRFRRLFILKAFTKLYAMAGLRLGYGISLDRELLEAMDGCRQPWSVSGPAQSAGEAALGETEYVNRARELVKRERSWLKAQMEGLGLFVYDSRANYIFFRDRTHSKTQEDSRTRTPESRSLYDACLKNGILIRSCANYRGLDSRFYRICVKDRANNETFIRVLKKAMEERD
ncbi:aminotransferase class I/II-fold pyridoxal phosphate-dependent enzyme, partial [Hungatella sp.]